MFRSEETDEHCPYCDTHLPEIKEDCFWLDSEARMLNTDGIKETIHFECWDCGKESAFVYLMDREGLIHYVATEWDDEDEEPDEEELKEYYAEQREQTRRDNMFERYEMGL